MSGTSFTLPTAIGVAKNVSNQSATVTTTDATVTSVQVLTVPANTGGQIMAKVVGNRANGDQSAYTVVAGFVNVAGVAAVVAVTPLLTAETTATTDCTIDATGATIRVRVTGVAAQTYNWSCLTTCQVTPAFA